MELPGYHVRGAYFESCNCEAICPCRMIGGVPGGRSTYGICYGVLSWLIHEGSVGDVDVSGLAAVLVCRYSDDEPGSPWTIALHVDRRGDDAQRAALETLFVEGLQNLPWIRKARHLIGVRVSEIEIEGPRIRVGSTISSETTSTEESTRSVRSGPSPVSSTRLERTASSVLGFRTHGSRRTDSPPNAPV